MFGQQRSTFGSGGSTFGPSFGTTSTTAASTGFGGTSSFSRFGTPQQTTSFGTGTTPFGAATSSATSLFGSQPQQTSGGLFGQQQTQATTGFSQATTGFGSTSGGGLFGQTQQPSTGLFGSTGTGGFGAQQSTQSRPFGFGQTTTSTTTTGGLFGTTPSTGGGLFGTTTGFGGTTGTVSGTTVKYEPVTGNDTMTRNGVSTNIRTRIEVITAMKEYENKSMEELRVEDYLANRKGQGQGGTLAGFGQTQQPGTQSQLGTSGGLFGTTGTSLFGTKPPESKPLFGTSASTGFGTGTGGNLFGTSTATPAFGQPSTTSTGFSFGQTAQQQPKSTGFNFGSSATTTPSLFGTTTQQQPQQPAFGIQGFPLGQNTQQQSTGGLFGTQNKPGTSGFLSTPNTGVGLFGNKPTGISQPLSTGFGTTSTVTPFGATTSTTTGGGLFSSPVTQNKPNPFTNYNYKNTKWTPVVKAVGRQNIPESMVVGSTGSRKDYTGGTGLFNNNQQKPSTLPFGTGFGNTTMGTGLGTSTGGGLFSSNPTGNTMGLSGTSLFNPSTGFGLSQQTTLGPGAGGGGGVFPDLGKLVKAMTEKPVFAINGKVSSPGKSGSPSAGDQGSTKMSSSNLKPTYVLSPSLVANTKPRPKPINKTNSQGNNRHWLFKGLEDPNEESAEDFLKPKKYPSVRTLNLKVFKGMKTEGNNNSSSSNASLDNSRRVLNGEVVGEAGADSPRPLTTPLSTLGDASPLPLSSNGPPLSHDDSPTPDIIKGRGNVKRLNLPVKGQQLDDTLTYFKVLSPREGEGEGEGEAGGDPDAAEANKENNNSISLFNASGDEDSPEAPTTAQEEPHPAGVKLRRPGYYTLPPLDELGQMVEGGEGGPTRCPVENFTVGRYGYGNVCFLGVTDVAGLDLDATVFIIRKQVEVYPQGTTKPPRGHQLNRPAIVTLDCVWPVDKSTREVIKSSERLQAMGWTDYLEKQCVKMEASFLEYRLETGSWVFKVKHFSKYGLQEDNEEEEMAVVPPKTSQIQPPPPQTTTSTTAASSAAALLPLALPHKTSGPPVTSLTSPPQFALGHTATATTTTTPVLSARHPQGRYLDAALQDGHATDDDFMESSVAKEPEESASLSILSPSAERLTVVSRVVPRTVQLAKLQLFGMRGEEEDEEDEGGAEGVVEQQKAQLSLRESTPTPQHHRVPKKMMVLSDLSGSRSQMSSPSLGEAKHRVALAEPPVPSPSKPGAVVVGVEGQVLRDPRSEYQVLPSGRDLGRDAGCAPPQHREALVPLNKSRLNGVQHCLADMGALMGRSFRVGWGPGWTLTHAGPPLALEQKAAPGREEEERDVPPQPLSPPDFLFMGTTTGRHKFTPTAQGPRYKLLTEKLHTIQPECGAITPLTEACLESVLERSVLEEGEEEMVDPTQPSQPARCPFFRPLKDVELLHQLADRAVAFPQEEDHPAMNEIFNLCVALWGRLHFFSPESDGEGEYSISQARVEAVSQWLEAVSQPTVEQEVARALGPDSQEEDYLEAILAHLSARQVSQACVLAQDKGDHHLALLLAQSCLGQDVPRQILAEQLANWAEGGTDAMMSPARLVLYSLLAGAPTHQASHTLVNTCTALDWRRALALHLWYVCPATATLAEALEEYDKAAGLKDDVPGYSNPPRPPYLATHTLRNNMRVSYDMCYHLLKLHTDPRHPLEALLNPATATPDPLNVTVSWLVWRVLESLNYHHLSARHSASLHLSMAALLESTGHWHWATLVLLHIADDERRQSEVQELLLRHVRVDEKEDKEEEEMEGGSSSSYTARQDFVVNRLGVPQKWIYQAKATRARSLNMVDEEAWYLLKAGDLSRAHALVVDTIAPNSIINEDHEYLQGYLDLLREGGRDSEVEGWAVGGGVYADYLEVCSLVQDMTTSGEPTPALLERLRPRLLALCSRLNNLKCHTALHRLCVSEMSKKVVGVLRAVVGEGSDATQVLSQQLSSLPLTHDYALAELNLVTNHYLTHLVAEP